MRRTLVVLHSLAGSLPSGVVVGTGAVWVANFGDATVQRFHPATFEEGAVRTSTASAGGRPASPSAKVRSGLRTRPTIPLPNRSGGGLDQHDRRRTRADSRRSGTRLRLGREHGRQDRLAHRPGDVRGRGDYRDRQRARTGLPSATGSSGSRSRRLRQTPTRDRPRSGRAGLSTIQPTRFDTSVGS